MTREEAIWYLTPIAESASLERYKEALSMAVAALREREERRWIPVTERLPDDGEQVIVVATGKPESNITLDNAIEFAEFSTDEGWILEMWPEWEDPKVTYWMPCPEPPKSWESAMGSTWPWDTVRK